MKNIRKNQGILLSSIALALASSTSFAQNNIELIPNGVITIDRTSDDTDGNCEPRVKDQCNLRAAVAKAAANNGLTVLELSTDSEVSLGEISIPSSANLLIYSREGHKIHGNATTKLFNIDTGATVLIQNTSISNFQGYNVGAIRNAGILTLANTTIENNKASCFGTGAMTAFATCYAGAIENVGTLILKDGTRILNNIAEATASTASFTNANASGGAIVSGGIIKLDGAVLFKGNVASALANSGFHGAMPGGASAVSSGGAIANSGVIEVTDAGRGQCRFEENEARDEASTAAGTATSDSKGGAVATVDLGELDLTSACVFSGNVADVDADVTVYPAL